MTDLFRTPGLDLEDAGVLAEIGDLRESLASSLRVQRRWTGGLRRTAQARAIQGSNSIEGYAVSNEDALAAVDGEDPLTADERTWAEIEGYRRVLTYVLHTADDPGFRLDAHSIRTMHFMLLEHELSKSPGRYRTGEIYVDRELTGERVYQGPDPDDVPDLVEALVQELSGSAEAVPLVNAAMAHLNLVMIHPFRDGNGRMSRVLHTLILAKSGTPEPLFSSIEEWLGNNTEDYYDVLGLVGGGGWNPDRDAHLWVKFCLRAHHMQAQTMRLRLDEAEVLGLEIEDVVTSFGLPDRTFDPLFDAARGLGVRRSGYVARSGIEDRTATRDLKSLVDAGLLVPQGNTRGRFYVASGSLRRRGIDSRAQRARLRDPYPWLVGRIKHDLSASRDADL